jgi:DNA adenine methylase
MATPFLKWAGGKARLVPVVAETLSGLPIERYIEPFLGGGAMFFGLRAGGLRAPAILADANPDLMATFAAVRDDVEAVIGALRPLAEAYLARDREGRRELYYRTRACEPAGAAARAARFIFLNRTCYNGLYRVNRQGRFNVPHGRYVRPRICDEANLRACAAELAGVELRCADFAEVCAEAGPGDFVYLDPPYHPLSATANFTAYTDRSFGWADQVRLAGAVRALAARGAWFALSNSAHPAVAALYEGLHPRTVQMPRAINSRASGRTPVPEYLFAEVGG